jgi:hypothetical protein
LAAAGATFALYAMTTHSYCQKQGGDKNCGFGREFTPLVTFTRTAQRTTVQFRSQQNTDVFP